MLCKIAAAAFSLTLCYGDSGENEITNFSNITIQKSFGVGIATSQLSFSTPAPFLAPFASKVVLGGVTCNVDYFISSRSLSNGVYTVNCVDRNAFLDEPIILTEEQSKRDYITVVDFLGMCIEQFGYSNAYGLPTWLDKIPTAEIEGKTYAAVLTQIAEAAYGTWVCERGNDLRFVATGNYTEALLLSEHTRIDVSPAPEIKGIIMTNNEGNSVLKGTGSRNYEVIQLENTLYAENSAYETAQDDIYNRVVLGIHNFGADYVVDNQVVSCQRAVLPEIPHTVSLFGFAQYPNVYYPIDTMNISITPTGIYASLSCKQHVDEIQTKGKITRELQNKIGYGNIGRNAVLTKFQGLMYSEEPEPASDEEAEE